MRLSPFWRYYGGKFRSAPTYPSPVHDTIVEPFAGAAGYSMRYHDRNVILVEKYHVIAEIWRYLIGVSADEILGIPETERVDALPDWVPQGGRWLVGFCMNDACASPCYSLSAGRVLLRAMGRKTQGWSATRKARIALQLPLIRHWQIIEGDYTQAPDVRATWFVDPPYAGAGRHYPHGSKGVDYASLAEWCKNRNGQTVVCENLGADWLPFREHRVQRTAMHGKTSTEAIWTNG